MQTRRDVTAALFAALLAACGGGGESGPNATAPGAPSAVAATADIRSAWVNWTAPASSGGTALTGYAVHVSPATPAAVATVTGTTALVTGLANGATYTFTVTASNGAGAGPASVASPPVTTPELPGAPTHLAATATSETVFLAWTAPAVTGGRPLTGYTVVVTPAAPSAVFSVSGTGATIANLTNGTTYTFQVYATSEVGDGAASASSGPVTPAGVPGAPTDVAAVADIRSASLTWSPPASTGGSALTGYTLSILPAAPAAVVTISGAAASITGLANGTSYTFAVTASNVAGASPASAPSSPVATPGLPGEPTNVAAVAAGPSVSVTWTAPGSTGGRPLTGYTVLVSPSAPAAFFSVAGTSATVTNLDSGTAYTFQVYATTAVGAGPASAPSGAATLSLYLVQLALSPGAASLPLGRSRQLVATATYSDGTSTDVTRLAAWSSGSPAAVAVSTAGLAAPAPGAMAGTNSVIAAAFGGGSGTSDLTLIPAATGIGPTLGNDPLLGQQWHLRNTGQTGYADNPGIAGYDIGPSAAYLAGYTGKGVKVAVVDNGLELLHQDLAANIAPGSWNFVTGTADPTSTATTGDHGTSVAGLIAMVYGNGLGGMGVSPGASLNGYNLISSSQSTAYFVASLGGSAAHPLSNDVSIFNQSFGISTTQDALVDPTLSAQYAWGVSTLRGGRGALYVKSAGNGFEGFEDSSPADCSAANSLGVSCQNANMDPSNTLPYNIVVGAMNASGVKSSYSTAGSAIWASAPGGEYGLNAAVWGTGYLPGDYAAAMVTTDQSGCAKGYSQTALLPNTSAFDNGGSPNSSCSYTNTMNGTSSAAPVTSGAIALILEANPTLTWRDVKHILAVTAVQVDSAIPPVVDATLIGGPYVAELPWTTNAAGYPFHNWYGFGLVNVDAAVAMAADYPYGQLGTFTNSGWLSSGALSLPIPDKSAAGVTSTIHVPATPRNLVVEAVQVSVSATHPYTGDLGIELTSPSGTKSILLNIKNGFNSTGLAGMVLESNAFYGEDSAGSWTIKVVDGWAGDTGSLTNWQLRVFGH